MLSHLYSFSFAPNPRWTRAFSPQREILDYSRDVAGRYGVVPHLRLRTGAAALRWDDRERHWGVDVDGQDDHDGYTADVVVGAMGALSEPSLSDIPGIGTFAGALFHSAGWDHGHDLAGERVAVTGPPCFVQGLSGFLLLDEGRGDGRGRSPFEGHDDIAAPDSARTDDRQQRDAPQSASQ